MKFLKKILIHTFFIINNLTQILSEQGEAIVKLQIRNFDSKGRDSDNDRCDPDFFGGYSDCDPKFEFCLDKYSGSNSVSSSCPYLHYKTSHYDDDDRINFGSNIKGMSNPIVAHVKNYEGIRFKVKVIDDDVDDDDDIDWFDWQHRLEPAKSEAAAIAYSTTINGKRRSNPSSMEISLRVYCDDYSYGNDCSVYCKPVHKDGIGHYNCDPITGVKYCLPGWEDVSNDCLIKEDNCEDANCLNGGTCVDLFNGYNCTCPQGYSGTLCELDIDECSSQPCLNEGVCHNAVNRYLCECTEFYTGGNCEVHKCSDPNAYYCENGGTCYENYVKNQLECFCAPGFTGKHCDIQICELLDCNHGMCIDGECLCEPEFSGELCTIALCDSYSDYCKNGANCINGRCVCQSGYFGLRCDESLCTNEQPCLHEGRCIITSNEVGFQCRCQPSYSGNFCENVLLGNSSTLNEKTTDKKFKLPWWALVLMIFLMLILVVLLVFLICRRRMTKPKEDTPPSYTDSIGHNVINDGRVMRISKGSTCGGINNKSVQYINGQINMQSTA